MGGLALLTCPSPLWVLCYFPSLQFAPRPTCVFSASAWNQLLFLRIHGSSYWTMVFRNQDLGTRHILCYWGVNSSKPSMWTELENIGTYRLTSIFSSVSLTPTQYHEAHSSVPLFLIYNFIFWQKEIWFSLLQYIFICLILVHIQRHFRVANLILLWEKNVLAKYAIRE